MTFAPGFLRPSVAVFSTWTLRGSTVGSVSGGTLTFTLSSASAHAGDLCVCFNLAVASPGPITITAPSGFTQDLYNTTATTIRAMVAHRILTSGDISGGTVSFAATGSGVGARGLMLVFSPDVALVSATASGAQSQETTGTPTTQTIAAPTLPAVLLGFGLSDSSTPTLSGTLPSSGTTVNCTDMFGKVSYQIQNSSFASKTIGCNDTGAHTILGSLIIQGA